MTIEEYKEAKENRIKDLQKQAHIIAKEIHNLKRRLDETLDELRDIKMDMNKEAFINGSNKF